jgi:hypothetical protein
MSMRQSFEPAISANIAAALFTCLCLFFGFHLFDKPDHLSAVGQIIGGWATTLAFFYIFHSFKIQESALALQSQTIADERSRFDEQRRIDQSQMLLASKTLSLEICQMAKALLNNQVELFYRTCKIIDANASAPNSNYEILPYLVYEYKIFDRIDQFKSNPAIVAICEVYVGIYEKYERIVVQDLGAGDIFHVYFKHTEEDVFLRFCSKILASQLAVEDETEF